MDVEVLTAARPPKRVPSSTPALCWSPEELTDPQSLPLCPRIALGASSQFLVLQFYPAVLVVVLPRLRGR